MHRVFGEEQAAKQLQTIGAGMDWLFRDVFYGLLLANEAILSTVETQMMTCAALACEGPILLRPLLTIHLGGLRNLGVHREEAEAVMRCVEMVAKWVGRDTGSWLPVRELVPSWEIEGYVPSSLPPVNEETTGTEYAES